MSIKGISEVRRLPRLGVIRLGEKAKTSSGKEYPRKLDHFSLVDAPGIAEVFGSKPKTIEIMLPHEDPEVFFPVYRKAYGRSSGLFCKGTGETASRTRMGVSDGKPGADGKVRLAAGVAFDPEGEKFIKEQGLDVKVGKRFELPCLGAECPYTLKKVCRPIGVFMFMVPKAQGVGVFQISTTSFNSIVDLGSYIDIVRQIAGRISMIPLTLSLVPKQAQVDGKAVGIFHLKLSYGGLLTDLVKYRDAAYFSASLLPELEHEVPEDLMPNGGRSLDAALGKSSDAPSQPDPEPEIEEGPSFGEEAPPPAPAPAAKTPEVMPKKPTPPAETKKPVRRLL